MDFKNRYQYNSKTDLLGRGGFATVYKAHDTLLNRIVALKFFTDSGGTNKHTLIQEISRAISLEHPNLCRYYDAAVLESVNLHGENETTEVGVMEYIDSGELKPYLAKNPEYMDKLLADVLQGLSYLHHRPEPIIHRDLKPQNILIKTTREGPIAKITDFGISKAVSTGTTSSSQLMGTVEYMAPEQFSPAKYGINGRIGTNLDLWSFGLMVYELVTGETMFGSRGGQSSAEQVMSNILNENLVEEKIKQLPPKYRALAARCLVKDAKGRVQNADELIALLNDKATARPEPESRGADTIILPKFSKEFNDTPPPGKSETPTQVINPIPEKPKVQVLPEVKKKNNTLIYVIVSLIVLGSGAWLIFSNKKTEPDDYHYALQHYGDTTTDFLPRLIKASKSGNDSASFKLAYYYYNNKKYNDAISAIQPLITKNDTAAIRLGGMCQYENGYLSYNNKNYNDALQWFNKGAANGNAKSQCMIGTMYYLGQGVAQNKSEAFQWYLKAADKQNDVGMLMVGRFYANGIGVLKNTDEAKKYLKWVVDNGKDEAKKDAASILAGL